MELKWKYTRIPWRFPTFSFFLLLCETVFRYRYGMITCLFFSYHILCTRDPFFSSAMCPPRQIAMLVDSLHFWVYQFSTQSCPQNVEAGFLQCKPRQTNAMPLFKIFQLPNLSSRIASLDLGLYFQQKWKPPWLNEMLRYWSTTSSDISKVNLRHPTLRKFLRHFVHLRAQQFSYF